MARIVAGALTSSEIARADTVGTVIPLEQAQSTVLAACPARQPVEMSLVDAIGCVLGADVVAAEEVPPFRNSAVDGYAVRAVDVANPPVDLAVVGDIPAGTAPKGAVGEGQAMRIMTGAPIPDGADSVVMVEDTVGGPQAERVNILRSVDVGAGIRAAGSDVEIGDHLFDAGTEITPSVAGVLASINQRTVTAVPVPTVAVLSTGDELVTDGRPLALGQIRESNLIMLDGLLRASGCRVVNLGVVADDEAALTDVLRSAAATADAIVTSGGVSMGDYDVVKAVLGVIADMTWMQVAIKPAKPFAFGVLDGTPIFGLPGNPVSSMVSFEMFARPALRQMAGHRRLARPSVVAVCDAALERRPDGRTHLMRAAAGFGDDGRVHIVPTRAQGSHQLAATAVANAIAVVPDGETVPAGAEVAVLLLDPLVR